MGVMSELAREMENQYDGSECIDLEKVMAEKVSLKLTKSEYIGLISMWENSSNIYNDYSFIKIVKDNELVEIKDINKFREFLKDCWDFWGGDNDSIKSIIMKLDVVEYSEGNDKEAK